MGNIKNETGVYMIFCIYNNYMYVGSATRSFNKRFKEHIRVLSKGIHHSPILQNCCNKYGLDSLKFTILYRSINKEDILKKEQYYIDLLKPICNICKYVQSIRGRKASDETRAKLREIFKKRRATPETKIKMSLAQKGRKHSEESKDKMRASMKGIKKTQEAKEKMSKSKKVLNKKGEKSATWKYISEEEKNNIISDYLDGNTFDFIKDKYSLARQTIRARLKLWGIPLRTPIETKYFNKEMPTKKIKSGRILDRFNKKVIDNSTGKIYDCILEAANELNYNYNTLKARLRGQLKNNTSIRYI